MTKVKAHIEGRQTTIDGDAVHQTVRGTMKGFGRGLHDYIQRGGQEVRAEIEVNVGMYPAGHARAGQFAVQIMVSPFADREAADTIADRLTNVVREALRKGPSPMLPTDSFPALPKKDQP